MADTRRWPALRIDAPGLEPADLADSLAALLDDAGVIAIEDRAELPLPPGGLWDPTFPPPPEPPPSPVRWRVFFNDAADRDRAAAAIARAFPFLDLEPVDVGDDDWAARSQRELTAVHAGKFIVAPPWDQPVAPPPGTVVITIEPSMGFGTGHHASTRLCLEAASDVDFRGRTVLDLGTGSGVLAMAASLCGARSVVAVDVDEDAIHSAEHSAQLNVLPAPVRFLVADYRKDSLDRADVVFANLTGGMLTTSAAAVRALVAPGGRLILSGFDEQERPGVEAVFPDLRVTRALTQQGWVGLLLDSPPSPA